MYSPPELLKVGKRLMVTLECPPTIPPSELSHEASDVLDLVAGNRTRDVGVDDVAVEGRTGEVVRIEVADPERGVLDLRARDGA
jgi:hypothetical protein